METVVNGLTVNSKYKADCLEFLTRNSKLVEVMFLDSSSYYVIIYRGCKFNFDKLRERYPELVGWTASTWEDMDMGIPILGILYEPSHFIGFDTLDAGQSLVCVLDKLYHLIELDKSFYKTPEKHVYEEAVDYLRSMYIFSCSNSSRGDGFAISMGNDLNAIKKLLGDGTLIRSATADEINEESNILSILEGENTSNSMFPCKFGYFICLNLILLLNGSNYFLTN